MQDNIRTRFAPSPTGYLHVGGLRTALYNYLFAKKYSGKMVLRIEDTDQTRKVENATQKLIDVLKQMNIQYDEGPDKMGPVGPYVQSQRQKIYLEHAHHLIETGDAYYCFCSQQRLDELRRQQEASNQQPKYDGRCRHLVQEEVAEKLAANATHVIRLKMPQEGETKFTDLIRGEVTFQNELIDDQILIKSDGFPTYHLANVVDDHFMQITHVIRGEEWLLSLPKHIRLYQAFGWEIPELAHVPLLLNPDRSKLSKRQGDVAVEDFLAKGYLPQALNNFVALLGWNPGTDQEIFSMEELIEKFSLERVNNSGAVFDVQKLNWMNGSYIRDMNPQQRKEFLAPFLENAGHDISDTERTGKIIEAVHKTLSRGDEISEKAALFYQDEFEIREEDAKKVLETPSAQPVLKSFLEKIENLPELDVNTFMKLMKEVQQETGYKKQELWMPVRVALTGVTHGPELPLVIEILGKAKIENFIRQILSKKS